MDFELMGHVRASVCVFIICCCSLAACSREEAPVAKPAPAAPAPATTALVDNNRLVNADAEPGNWLSNGRTYSEQRYSPLDQINEATVGDLGLAWYLDLDTSRGQQASPLIVDGVMYSTSAWSKVQAINAATGELLWQYDPEVPPEWDANNNRGRTEV